MTGSGKSTLINYLLGAKFEWELVQVGSKKEEAPIGSTPLIEMRR
jgi:predicted GTPase